MYSWFNFHCLFQIYLIVSGSLIEQQLTSVGALPLTNNQLKSTQKEASVTVSTDEELWKGWEDISKIYFVAGEWNRCVKPDDTITSQFYVVFGLLKSGRLIFQGTHNVLGILIR